MLKKLFLLFPLILQTCTTVKPAYAQQTVIQRPDCMLPISPLLTANGSVGPIDNRGSGCTFWVFAYASTGFSAVNLTVQTAPDASGVPGAWSTFTAASGSNPNTNTTGATSTFGGSTSYFPWLRVLFTKTGTGTVYGVLYGWRSAAAITAVIPGTVTVIGNKANNAVVPGNTNLGVLPCLANAAAPTWTEGFQVVCSEDLNGNQRVTNYSQTGAATEQDIACNQQFYLRVTDATRVELVALTALQSIRVCHMHVSTTAPETFTVTNGTGSACASGTTTLDSFLSTQSFAMDYGPKSPLRVPAGNALCFAQSAVQNADVFITYAKGAF